MAKVPYTGVPEIGTQAIRTPGISASGPAAAFGAESAEGMQALSGALGKASNDIFARAMALQELANHAEATEADSKYMIEAGKLHADYNALEGKAAVDAYPKYQEDLKAVREKIGSTLSNPASQRMYESSSRSTMARTIFNGAGHAAAANKRWLVGTAAAQMDLDMQMVQENPKDDVLFQDKLRRVVDSTKSLTALKGFEPDGAEEKSAVKDAVSKLWSQRIVGLSRTAPFEAGQMLDARAKFMNETDRLKTEQVVRAASRSVGSVNIATEIYNAGQETETSPGKSLKDMEDEARARAKKMSPDDPILANQAVTALQGLYNQDKRAKAQEKYTHQQIVSTGIQRGVKNIQELRADPKVAAAIDALPQTEQEAIPGRINRYNASRDKITNEETFLRLKGMANNDVESFLNTDLTKEALSKGDMDRLLTLQGKIKEQPFNDPRVSRAQQQIRGAHAAELEALGIYSRTPKNKEDFDRYTGAVQQALDVWQDTHGKPATYKDIVETIAPQVIRTITEPGWLWGTNEVPFFKQTMPAKWKEDAIAAITAAGGKIPSDELLYRGFLREQYQKLYGKKPAAPEGPKVPRSQ